MAQVSNKELRKQQTRQVQMAWQEAHANVQDRLQRLDRTLLFVIISLCLVGIGIAGYLTYVHYAHVAIVCTSGGGCEVVNNSKYAVFLGVPVALMGLGAYITLLGLAIVRLRLNTLNSNNRRYALDTGIFLLNLGGVAFSGYLTSMEAFVINNWCMWCVGSASTLTILLFINGYRLWLNYFSAAAPL